MQAPPYTIRTEARGYVAVTFYPEDGPAVTGHLHYREDALVWLEEQTGEPILTTLQKMQTTLQESGRVDMGLLVLLLRAGTMWDDGGVPADLIERSLLLPKERRAAYLAVQRGLALAFGEVEDTPLKKPEPEPESPRSRPSASTREPSNEPASVSG